MTTPEALTPEERARLEWEMSDEDDAPDGPSTELVTKLLRIHDQQAARITELEKQAALYDQECGMCGSTAEELVEYAEWYNSRKAGG